MSWGNEGGLRPQVLVVYIIVSRAPMSVERLFKLLFNFLEFNHISNSTFIGLEQVQCWGASIMQP